MITNPKLDCDSYYLDDQENSGHCIVGCLFSCFEMKGSDHACSGGAAFNCQNIGSEPACTEGDCSWVPEDNDCYRGYQVGCTYINNNIQAISSAATTDAPAAAYSVTCTEKCIAIFGWIDPSRSASCLIGCTSAENNPSIDCGAGRFQNKRVMTLVTIP